MDRPKYEDAADAYDYWAKAIMTRDKEKTDYAFAKYCADCYRSSKCYARDYLKMISNGNVLLQEAFDSYAEAAQHLRSVSLPFADKAIPDEPVLGDVQKEILLARDAENKAQELIGRHVKMR